MQMLYIGHIEIVHKHTEKRKRKIKICTKSILLNE